MPKRSPRVLLNPGKFENRPLGPTIYNCHHFSNLQAQPFHIFEPLREWKVSALWMVFENLSNRHHRLNCYVLCPKS